MANPTELVARPVVEAPVRRASWLNCAEDRGRLFDVTRCHPAEGAIAFIDADRIDGNHVDFRVSQLANQIATAPMRSSP
jgi:hypothetical protein